MTQTMTHPLVPATMTSCTESELQHVDGGNALLVGVLIAGIAIGFVGGAVIGFNAYVNANTPTEVFSDGFDSHP